MAADTSLDAAGGPRKGRLIFSLIAVLLLGSLDFAQERPSDSARLASAQSALDSGHWEEAASLAHGPADQSAALDFLAGLALARLQKWNDARAAFEAGLQKRSNDPRFLVELAGVAYKQSDFAGAKKNLQAALRLNSKDAYAREFLATLFFLEGNLEAALKYWNPEDKPRLRGVSFVPPPQLRETLRDRAVAFNAPQVLTTDALLTTQARLNSLGVFSHPRFELTPAGAGNYDAALRLSERNGWGDSKLEGAISLLGGVPYATVYPEFYNLGHAAVNFTSLARWDSEKRRIALSLSAPLENDPRFRLRAYLDARNENWNLMRTFFGAGIPLSDLNMRRATAGADVRLVVNGRWSWNTGMEIAFRNFRNVDGHTSAAERPFFTNSASLAGWLGFERTLVRVPERRFTLDTAMQARAGREFSNALGPFGALRGSVRAHWFPQAKGEDYEMQAQIRAGGFAGHATLDELFELGIERDNDLWLRGHAGTIDGRKGGAPLGRRFFLANWEMDKNVFRTGFLTLKIGPFVDNGAIADSSGLFGSQSWLWDLGVQGKVQVLGSITVVLCYGRDLRGGRNMFYPTVIR